MEQREELMDALYQAMGCTYYSDLRCDTYRRRAIRFAAGLSPGAYPLAQWQDAANYLTDTELTFDSPEAVRAYFSSLMEAVEDGETEKRGF